MKRRSLSRTMSWRSGEVWSVPGPTAPAWKCNREEKVSELFLNRADGR
jgi:hypothetical protein